MLDWIYDLPVKTLGTWMAVVFVGYCWVGGLLLRPFLRPFVRSRYSGNHIVGYVLSSFGIFYGLLLGLIAVAAYQNFSRVGDNVAMEVASLETLNEDVWTFPEPHGQRLRMGRIRADRQFDIVYETTTWIQPQPYPQIAFPGWRCDWTESGKERR